MADYDRLAKAADAVPGPASVSPRSRVAARRRPEVSAGGDDGSLGRVIDAFEAGRTVGRPMPAQTRITRRTVGPTIQRVRLYWKGHTIRPPKDEDPKELVFETDDLSEQRYGELVKMLGGKADLLQQVKDGRQRSAEEKIKNAPPTLTELFGMGDELTLLENAPAPLDTPQTKRLAEIISKLRLSLRDVDDSQEDGRLHRDALRGLQLRAGAMWQKKKKDDSVKVDAPPGGRVRATDITQGEIAAYRSDIEAQGTWGGLAEADRGARALSIQTHIFQIDENGNYRRIIQIGSGANNVNHWSLLHRGDHYDVVANAVDGQAFAQGHVQGATNPVGDCLFEALLMIRHGINVLQQPNFADVLTQFRKDVAAALTDDQIRASLIHILVHGESTGLGEGTRRVVEARGADPASMRNQLKGVPGSKELLEEYEGAFVEDPSSERTQAALRKLRQHRLKQGSTSKIPFVSTAADVQAGRYTYKETVKTQKKGDVNPSVKIRLASAENGFQDQAGRTVEQAMEEALLVIDLTGSSSATHSRHDFQPSGATRENLQIQLGGTQLDYRRGKGDTSITLVVIDAAFFEEMSLADPARWIEVLRACHRRSFHLPGRIDIGPPPKDKKDGKG